MAIFYKFRYILPLLILVICLPQSNASEVDSLQEALQKHLEEKGEDTVALNILIKLYNKTVETDLFSAMEYAAQGKQIAENLNDSNYIAIMNIYLGNVYYTNKIYYMAMELYSKAYEIFANKDNKKMLANSLLQIGKTYLAQEVYDQAQEYFEKAAKIYEEIEDKEGLANTYEFVGLANKNIDEDIALENFFASLKIRKELKLTKDIAKSYSNIAQTYFLLQETDSALFFVNKSIKIYKQIKEKTKLAENYTLLGDIYLYLKNYTKAWNYYNMALSIYKENEVNQKIALLYNKISLTNLEKGRYEIAIQYANDALAIANTFGYLEIKKFAFGNLTKAYEKTQDYKKALSANKRLTEVSDSIYMEKKRRQFSELQVSIETQRQQKEIEFIQINAEKERLELAQKQYKRNTFFILVIAILILLSLIGLYYRNQEKSKTNKLLQESNKRMQREIEERKAAEAELKLSEERYRLLFRKTPIGIMQFDEKLHITNANDRFIQIFKLNKRRVIGSNAKLIFDKSLVKVLSAALEKQGQIFREEREIKTETGKVYVSITIKPYFYTVDDEVIKGGILIVEDITEKKQAELFFKESEQRNKTFFKLFPDTVFIFNKEGHYIDVRNPYEPDAYVKYQDKNITEILPQDVGVKILKEVNKYINGESYDNTFTYAKIINEGLKFFEAKFVADKERFLIAVRDITKHIEKINQLQQKERIYNKKIFNYKILQKNLSSIINKYTSNIKANINNPKLIERNIEIVNHLIEDFNTISKLNKNNVKFRYINIRQVIDEIISIYDIRQTVINLDGYNKIAFNELSLYQLIISLYSFILKPYDKHLSITIGNSRKYEYENVSMETTNIFFEIKLSEEILSSITQDYILDLLKGYVIQNNGRIEVKEDSLNIIFTTQITHKIRQEIKENQADSIIYKENNVYIVKDKLDYIIIDSILSEHNANTYITDAVRIKENIKNIDDGSIILISVSVFDSVKIHNTIPLDKKEKIKFVFYNDNPMLMHKICEFYGKAGFFDRQEKYDLLNAVACIAKYEIAPDFKKILAKQTFGKRKYTETEAQIRHRITPEFIKIFKKDIVSRYEGMNKQLSFLIIKNFAEDIIDLGDKYKIEFVKEYGEKLIEELNLFDVVKIIETLKDFEKIHKKIEEYTSNKQPH